MEKTNIDLPYLEKLVDSTQFTREGESCIRRLPWSRFSLKKIVKEIGEKKDVES
jgi:hypothetical protein